MKINWLKYENKNHVMAWVLLECMSEIGIETFGEFDSSNIDVELRINGIEVPVEKPMDFLNSQLDEIEANGIEKGREKERNILREKLYNLLGDYE